MQRILSGSNWWNRLLPITLILAGASIIVIALAADLLDFGGPRGIGPRQAAMALSGLSVFLAGVVLISSIRQRYIVEWLLVALASIAVAFAADLLVINGLPEFGAKHLVLASIGFSILLTGILSSSADRMNASPWLNLDKLQISKFLSIAVQLGLLVIVIRLFHLENQAFYHSFIMLTFYGFLIHYFLPSHYRLPFFLFLSLAAIVGILGFSNGIWLLAIGLGLIGICHLPVSYNVRVAILLAAGAVLVALRAGWLQASWLDVIWPVLASMFMFRLIIYVYDLKHGKAKPTLASTLSYFFLLPNVVFPFFPVVDYSTFRRTYYNDDDQHRIYQTGVHWMLMGVIHLILYRFVNYYLMIAPGDVTNSLELVRYLISNFALYLRISGQFHLIIGTLHLFGFNLPETHHLYFLASSFTDLWRRINIYWKDFMLKVFYYPTYFRIRNWGANNSLIFATAFVFFLTWFFHAYQWFWLRGTFLLTAPDILFWFILACLVIVNTLYEARRGRKRTLGQHTMAFGDVAVLALRTAGTFSVMAVLWSLWSSESIQDWITLISVVDFTLENIAFLILVFVAITVVFGLVIWFKSRGDHTKTKANQSGSLRSTAVTAGTIALLFFIGNPVIYARIGGRGQELISDLTVNRLSDLEAALLQRGYYEDLIGVNRFNSQLWEIYTKRPTDWVSIRDTAAVRQTNDDFIVELVPSTSIDFNGTRLTTNRWGMRDRDYEMIPAPDTYRIALTGPSFVMGYGVADHEGFDPLLEDRLNRESAGTSYSKYEILNFAVPGYSALQNLIVLEQKAMPFQPNAIFFMAHQREEEAVVLYLADRISAGAELPYSDLMEMARQAGAEHGATKAETVRRLQPIATDILSWTYRRIVEESRAKGILPVWIFMPTLENPLRQEEITHLTRVAEDSGFIVLDLSDAYDNHDPDSLVVAYWDKHPNAMGHRLIAEDLYRKLQEKKEEIPLFQ